MYKIICSYCEKELTFKNLSEIPKFCKKCNTPLENQMAEEISDSESTQANSKKSNEENRKPAGLSLIYQKTNEKIDIVHTEKQVIGRWNFGAEVLEAISRKISRKHCLIEFIDNQYKITDLDSKNGTYIGTSKINCKENPQQTLSDGEFVYLGPELFLAKLTLFMKTLTISTLKLSW